MRININKNAVCFTYVCACVRVVRSTKSIHLDIADYTVYSRVNQSWSFTIDLNDPMIYFVSIFAIENLHSPLVVLLIEKKIN